MPLRADPAASARPPTRLDRLADAYPSGSFAFTMATGIVSLAAHALGFAAIARALLWLNLAVFPVLWLLLLLRLARGRRGLYADLVDPRRSPGFLTIVAGTAVLGTQCGVLLAAPNVAAAIWLVCCALWTVLIYAFFAAMTLGPPRMRQPVAIDGSWLLAVVATQSLTVLGTQVASAFALPALVVYASLCWFLLGALLYVALIVLILHRWLVRPKQPAQFRPPDWINMGAAAISILAGARLQAVAGSGPLLHAILPAVEAATALFWAVATWWLPLLVIVMAWHHFARRVPLTYSFAYWSMVFPLGMYTAATAAFARQDGLPFLLVIPHVSFWLAFAAWAVVLVGMVRHLAVSLRAGWGADGAPAPR